MLLDLWVGTLQVTAVAPRESVRSKANPTRPRGPSNRAAKHAIQIVFWNLPRSPALEAAIRAEVDRLPEAPGTYHCRVSLSVEGRLAGATPNFSSEVHLSSFAPGHLEGWKVIVRSCHEDARQAVRMAVRSAAHVLISGRIRAPRQRHLTAATVQLQPQPGPARGVTMASLPRA